MEKNDEQLRKTFSLGAILSLTTGILMDDFGDMQALAEHVAGHPIWTHEFADRAFCDKLKDAILEQHPDLADCVSSGVNGDNWQQRLDEWKVRYGAERQIIKGGESRSESPLQSAVRLFPDKSVIPVVVEKRA